MNIKLHLLCAIVGIFVVQASIANQCDNFYSKVTYALSHTKKGLSATNFEHQMYYAERALTALEKGKAFMSDCSCEKAPDKTLDVLETLDKAIEPIDWEAGRFFTKKAMGQINELITILDNCTLGVSYPQEVEDSDVAKLEHQAHSNKSDATPEQDTMEKEMIAIFEKHAKERLVKAEAAIKELLEFAETIEVQRPEDLQNPNSLASHKNSYLVQAKKLLQQSTEQLGRE